MEVAAHSALPTGAMDNCTATNASCSAGELREHAFLAFCVVFAILVIATAVLLIFTLIAVCSASTMAKTLRMILVSLLIAVLLVAFAGLTELVIPIPLALLDVQDPSQPFCRFVLWTYAVGSVARLFNTATFSVAVLLLEGRQRSAVNVAGIVLFLVLLWSGAILLNTHILVPPIFTVQYVDGLACFPRAIIKPARYALTAIWIFLGGVVPVVVSIVVPIITLCYIKRRYVIEGSNYNVKLAQFALFLFSGSFITLLGQAVVGAIVYSSDAPAVYATFVVASLSLLPAPLLIIAYLEEVRQRMRAMLVTCCLCCCYRKKRKNQNLQLGATSSVTRDPFLIYSALDGQE